MQVSLKMFRWKILGDDHFVQKSQSALFHSIECEQHLLRHIGEILVLHGNESECYMEHRYSFSTSRLLIPSCSFRNKTIISEVLSTLLIGTVLNR
jgi:hypothetical protein